MSRRRSKALIWLRNVIAFLGIIAFVVGVTWFWRMRDVWPRAAGDPVPQALLESLGVIIGGLYLYAKGRPYHR